LKNLLIFFACDSKASTGAVSNACSVVVVDAPVPIIRNIWDVFCG